MKALQTIEAIHRLIDNRSKMTNREIAQLTGTKRAYAVRDYAIELLDALEEGAKYAQETYGEDLTITEKVALSGASDWQQFSHGGCSLYYNHQIAERLRLSKRTNGTRLLDIQAEELRNAWFLIWHFVPKTTAPKYRECRIKDCGSVRFALCWSANQHKAIAEMKPWQLRTAEQRRLHDLALAGEKPYFIGTETEARLYYGIPQRHSVLRNFNSDHRVGVWCIMKDYCGNRLSLCPIC